MDQITCLNRRKFIRYGSLAVGAGIVAACTNNQSPESNPEEVSSSNGSKELDKITFGTNWYAEAEHGGYYQAVATGIYEEYGLDVTIKMGSPQTGEGTQLLMGGAVDFFMGYGISAIKAIEQDIPKMTIAAIFQKDPQILIAHPNQGINSLEDLKGRPIYVSPVANTTYWPFLKAKYGFTDDQKRPYNFNVGPFLKNKDAAQQGYLSSEPLKIEKKGGFEPQVFLLANYGYDPYSNTIETRRELVENNPDLVRRFVEASIQGWYSYLENPEPGNKLIKEANPEMTDEQIAYSREKMTEYGLLTSGAAENLGIGAMTEERWQSFFNDMVEAGMFSSGTDYTKAFSLEFVNKGAEAYQT